MNMRNIESKIVIAAALQDKQTIVDIHSELSNTKAKMDRWFNKYLDLYGEKLDTADRKDPIRKLYNSKFDEYSNVSRVLKVAEIYMKENNV